MSEANKNSFKTENNNAEYFVGVDWGKKRCGLAIADTETRIATGFGECSSGELAKKIAKLSAKMKIQEIIVGFSEVLENIHQNNLIKYAIADLEKEGHSVKLEEELFSTKLAQQNLLQAEKKQVSKNDNAESARIILQGWLDKAV